jgi:MFS family permease
MLFMSLLDLSNFTPRIRSMLWGQFFMNASHFMAAPLLAIFLAKDLQMNPAELGTVMAANLIFAQALPLFAGPFADRYGAKLCMVLGLLLRGAGLAGIAFNENFYLLVASASLSGAGVAIYESALFGVFGQEPVDQRSKVFAANNQMLNLGVIVGPLVGTLASQISIATCFAVGAFAFFVLAFRLSFRADMVILKSSQPRLFNGMASAFKNPDFRLLVIASMPWYFLFPQLYVTFPLYMSNLGGDTSSGLIYIVNGVVGVTYMVLARQWLTRTPSTQLLLLAYIGATALFGSMVFSTTLIWFLLFVAGYTIVETTILPALEVLTSTLSDESSQSTYFGVLSVAGALAGTLGYYAGSWLVLRGNPYDLWAVLGSVGFLGVLFTLAFSSRVTKRGAVKLHENG